VVNFCDQVVIMLYEDPTKDPSSDQRFHVELHFSPGVNCCVQKDLPPGPGFRPHSRNHENSSAVVLSGNCSEADLDRAFGAGARGRDQPQNAERGESQVEIRVQPDEPEKSVGPKRVSISEPIPVVAAAAGRLKRKSYPCDDDDDDDDENEGLNVSEIIPRIDSLATRCVKAASGSYPGTSAVDGRGEDDEDGDGTLSRSLDHEPFSQKLEDGSDGEGEAGHGPSGHCGLTFIVSHLFFADRHRRHATWSQGDDRPRASATPAVGEGKCAHSGPATPRTRALGSFQRLSPRSLSTRRRPLSSRLTS